MSKPAEVWGPHWLSFPKVLSDEVRKDDYYSLCNTMLAIAAAPEIVALPNRNPEDPPNLHVVRGVTARLLAKASDSDSFFNYALEHGGVNRPSDAVREYTFGLLQYFASLSGILHGTEIEYIKKHSWGHAPHYFYDFEKNIALESREQVIEATQLWKSQGYKIGVFQGAFDPVIPSHLINATESFLWTQNRGEKLKLIWVFDNNELIKRKGKDRPRFKDLRKRRVSIENFWNVSATIESSVTDTKNTSEYAGEYIELNIDYVFVPLEDKVNLLDRQKSADLGGAQAIPISYADNFPHSTKVVAVREDYLALFGK